MADDGGHSGIKAALLDAVKAAMRARDAQRLGTLRLLSAAIKQREVDTREVLADADVIAVLDREVKQRRESISQYAQAGRDDLAAVERVEIDIIQEFLPRQLEAGEIDALIDQAIVEAGASGMRDMGKVMGLLRPRLQGRADVGAASAVVKARLAG
jgi:uncharacterized protein